MSTKISLTGTQTTDEIKAAKRLTAARALIMPLQDVIHVYPEVTPAPTASEGSGRALVKSVGSVVDHIPRPTDNNTAAYFKWTEKLAIERASLSYWVRVPLRPGTTHQEYMSKTRSVARTRRLLRRALRTMRKSEEERTYSDKTGLYKAISEYQQSMYTEKGKWELPKSTHRAYHKLVEILSKDAPTFVQGTPSSEEEMRLFPFGRPLPETRAKRLPPLYAFSVEPVPGEVYESVGPEEILKMYEGNLVKQEELKKRWHGMGIHDF